MLRLRTFGGIAVERDGRLVGGAASQRKPLALLALLASSGEQGISRERIALLLWPESEAGQSSNLLRQRLFHLRRDLDSPDLLEGSVQLRLNPAIISSDVWDFESALARGDLASAATSYAGQFLDGFHLSRADEFERWCSEKRENLSSRAKKTLRTLAVQAGNVGDHEEAAAWWQRIAELDPLDSASAVKFMEVLMAAGQCDAALRHAELHDRVVRQELGSVAPEVVELLHRLRAEQSHKRTPRSTPIPALPAQTSQYEVTVTPVPSRIAEPVAVVRVSSKPRRYAGIVAATLATLITVIWLSSRALTSGVPPDVRESTIAVFPFNFRGGSSSDYLGEGVSDLLAIRLNGAGKLRSADSRTLAGLAASDSTLPITVERRRDLARKVGAGRFVLGDLVQAGNTVHLVATLYDHSARATGSAAVSGKPEGLAALVDQLAGRLLADVHDAPGERLLRTAALTTSSFPALKEYLVGEQELRAGRPNTAADAFKRATDHDSTFALAYYRMAVAAESAPWGESVTDSAARRAVQLSSKLAVRDRLRLTAFLARRQGHHAEAEQRYRVIVSWFPDDVDAWYQLAEIQFHYDPFRGFPISAAKESYERVMRLRPNSFDALTHLDRIAAREGNRRAVDSIGRRMTQLVPATANSPSFLTFQGAALRDTAAVARGLAGLAAGADEFVSVTMRQVAMHVLDVGTYEHLARELAGPKRQPWYRAIGYLSLANAHLARGRVREAQLALQRQPGFSQNWSLELRAIYAALPFVPRDSSAFDSLRRTLAVARPVRPTEIPANQSLFSGWDERLVPFALGLIALRSDDLITAQAHAIRLESQKGLSADSVFLRLLARTVRAEIMRARGRPAEALQILGDDRPQGTLSDLGFPLGCQVYQRYLRAELLRESGRYEEALRWYRSLVQGAASEIAYLAPSYLRQAQIYDATGRKGLAVENYARFIDLWKVADPELQPMVHLARKRITELRRS